MYAFKFHFFHLTETRRFDLFLKPEIRISSHTSPFEPVNGPINTQITFCLKANLVDHCSKSRTTFQTSLSYHKLPLSRAFEAPLGP